MVSDRTFIFHIYIPWGKTLSLVTKSKTRSNIKVIVLKKKKRLLQGGGICVSQIHLVNLGPKLKYPFCGKGLTLYHTVPTFKDPKEEGFGKHCGKRRKCW